MFIIIGITTLLKVILCSQILVQHFDILQNHALDVSPFKIFFGTSTIQCIFECQTDPFCISVNIRHGVCEFLRKSQQGASIFEILGSKHIESLWNCHKKSCYSPIGVKRFTSKQHADIICAEIGSHVIAPESDDEINWLHYIIGNDDRFKVVPGSFNIYASWIDMDDSNGKWFYNHKYVNTTRWAVNEPDKPSENCVIQFALDSSWHDVFCDYKFSFVCEVDLN